MLRRHGVLALALALPLFMAIPASASPIVVSFESGSTGVLSFFGDQFSLNAPGAEGSLNLDSEAPTTATINSATLNIADYTNDDGGYESRPLQLSFDLTLDGVTHSLTQNASWTITPTYDSVVSTAASAPVQFNTASGPWTVTLNGFSVGGPGLGTFSTPVTASVQGVPEPATILLFGTALIGGGIQRWRKQRRVIATA